MSRVSVAMLGLLPEMERVYMLERTDRARAAALARGASPGPKPKLGVDDVERGLPARRQGTVDGGDLRQDGRFRGHPVSADPFPTI